MKRIYVLLLLVGCMLLSGCTIEYNVVVGIQDLKEAFVVTAYEDESFSKSALFEEYISEYPIYSDQHFDYINPTNKIPEYDYFKKSYQELENGYVFNYEANYKLDNMKQATTWNAVFDVIDFGYLKEKNYHYLSLGKTRIFDYSNLEELIVHVTFADNITVLESNADNEINGVYTWNINKDSRINLKYRTLEDKKNEEENPIDKEDSKHEGKESWIAKHSSLIIGITLIIFGVGLIAIIYVKKNKL